MFLHCLTKGSRAASSLPHLQHVGSHGMSIVKREVKDEVPFIRTAENTEFITPRKQLKSQDRKPPCQILQKNSEVPPQQQDKARGLENANVATNNAVLGQLMQDTR